MTPTGAQFEIRHADQVATVTELGATLRRYDVAGRAVVDGFDETARPDGGRGQVLAPWPNRIKDGRYDFDGQTQQLPLTEPARGNAIHGLVRWAGWSCTAHTESQVTLQTQVFPQPGYPGHLVLEVTYALGDSGLETTVSATNIGQTTVPYGVGHHPYLTLGVPVDEVALELPAGARLVSDDRGIPVGEERVVGTAYDFREPRAITDLQLDCAFTDLRHDDDGRVRVALRHDDARLVLWGDATVVCLQVFSGDTLPDPARRRRGLAVEPMSCPPDAFNSGRDLVVLAPGDRHRLTWGIDPC